MIDNYKNKMIDTSPANKDTRKPTSREKLCPQCSSIVQSFARTCDCGHRFVFNRKPKKKYTNDHMCIQSGEGDDTIDIVIFDDKAKRSMVWDDDGFMPRHTVGLSPTAEAKKKAEQKKIAELMASISKRQSG